MPIPGALLLEVYQPGGEALDWSVSTDPDHVWPYLIGPENYQAQEIDPIAGASTIGTVEVGVIDPAQELGDQDSGWMTERVGELRGRRCRLRRYIDEITGYVTISDGPAGTARLDQSYSAYRFPIRDTREIERKLSAFKAGGTCGVAPFGPIFGFGYDEEEDDYLLEPVTPFTAVYDVNEGSMFGVRIGYVTIDWPAGVPPIEAVVTKEQEQVLQSRSDGLVSTIPYADVMWRQVGQEDWNVARPQWPVPFNGGQIGLCEIADGVIAGENVRAITRIYLWAMPIGETDDSAPMASEGGGGLFNLEVIIRHRGEASEDFPYYYQGTAGQLLADLYDGLFSGIDPVVEAARPRGFDALYDPAGLEDVALLLAGGVKYDPDAVAQMTAPVLLRQTSGVDDGRAWSEEKVYGPSGWIPALDGDGVISPVSRDRPAEVTGPLIQGSVVEPAPDWNSGERVVTRVQLDYPRYFVPVYVEVETERDGLAIQPISEIFVDADAESTEGQQPQVFDGSVFGAVGDGSGGSMGEEAGNTLAQAARYEVLGRYRAGAQAFYVRVLRSAVPFVRVGDWCPAQISWLPNTATKRRGLDLEAVQVLSIDDSEYAWRYMLLEQSPVAAPPGYFDELEVVSDEPGAGYIDSLELIEDSEES